MLKKQEIMLNQEFAKQILKISKSVEQVYLDQIKIIGALDSQSLFQVDRAKHTIFILNHLFQISFSLDNEKVGIQCVFQNNEKIAPRIERFILNELYFLTHELEPENSMILREKATQFRNMLCEQIYSWVNGQKRIENWLENLSAVQSEIIDYLMIKQGFYKTKILSKAQHNQSFKIPDEIKELFKDILRLDFLLGD